MYFKTGNQIPLLFLCIDALNIYIFNQIELLYRDHKCTS